MDKPFGCLNDCVYKKNVPLWEHIDKMAKSLHLHVRANKTTVCNFEGLVSYVMLEPGFTNYARTSKSCIGWTFAPYTRYWRPSIKGEKQALQRLINKLESEVKCISKK